MPKITVLTITARNLYLDEQVKALESQTLQDFEWVVVDSNYITNKLWLAKLCSFRLTHLPDRTKRGYFAGGQAYNQGIAHSKGELVYFMADYVLPNPICLERHWEIYNKFRNVFISGRSVRIDATPAKFNSVSGMIGGKDFRLGMGEEKTQIEPDLWLVKHSISPMWWSGRNDSAPLEALLECNGFEEDLDGNWGGHDGELANRMATLGFYYLYDTKSLCLEFAHKSGDLGQTRPDSEQLDLAKNLVLTKRKEGVYKSNLKRSLREERNEWLTV